jgi:hypothetical protein
MKASHDSNGCNCLVRGAVTGGYASVPRQFKHHAHRTERYHEHLQYLRFGAELLFAEFDEGGPLDW